MADQTKAEKAAAEAEAARRAALTDEERALEDKAAANGLTVDEQRELDDLEAQEAAKNNPAERARQLRAKADAAKKAAYLKAATIKATVAPGRTVFTEPGQKVGHKEGAEIMVTPGEYQRLVAQGHVRDPEGKLVERSGPKVLRDAGLVQGHTAGPQVTEK